MEKKKNDEFNVFFLELLNKEMNEGQQILISSFGGYGSSTLSGINALYVCGDNFGYCESDNDSCNTGNCVAGCSCKS